MQKENYPKISLIIPVYNSKDLISRCMTIVQAQTYPCMEVVVVDDGSTDGTSAVCDGFLDLYDNVKVVHHPKNAGLSCARNTGIASSTGEYISFVDADDIISDKYLEVLYNLCIEYDVPLSACNHNIVRGKSIKTRFPRRNDPITLTEKQILENILYQGIPDVSAWGKLYKRSVLSDISYPAGKLYEDTARIAEIIINARKMAFTYEPLYDYIISEDSISHGGYNPRRLEYIESIDHTADVIGQKYPDLKRACICSRVFAALSVRRFFVYEPDADKEVRKKLETFIKKNAASVLFNRRTPLRNKTGVIALLISPGCYNLFWRVYRSMR